jgi:hypothetical protein
MAVLAVFTGAITNVQYGTLQFTVKWAAKAPAGAILHTAYFDGAGKIHVADVWDSPEAFDAFLTGRLLPALDALRIKRPDVAVYPIRTLEAYRAISAYLA